MHLAPTERQQRLRAELRSYFRTLMPDATPDAADDAIPDAADDATPDAADDGHGGERGPGGGPDAGEQRRLLRRIGADGLLGLGWPEEYGGRGRGPDEQFVFFDEAYR